MSWIFNNFPLNFELLWFDLRLWKVGLNYVVLHLNAFIVSIMAFELRWISAPIPLCVFTCGNPSMTSLSERRRFWTAAEVDIALVTIRVFCWTSNKPLWLQSASGIIRWEENVHIMLFFQCMNSFRYWFLSLSLTVGCTELFSTRPPKNFSSALCLDQTKHKGGVRKIALECPFNHTYHQSS